MDLALSDEQEQLVDSFADLFAKQAAPERVRAAEPLGPRRRPVGARWSPSAPRRWPSARAPAGGAPRCSTSRWWPSWRGGSWRPAPLIETQVAARLLAAAGDARRAAEALPRAPSPGRSSSPSPLRPAAAGRPAAGARPAPSPTSCVALDGDRLVVVPSPTLERRPVDNLGGAAAGRPGRRRRRRRAGQGPAARSPPSRRRSTSGSS